MSFNSIKNNSNERKQVVPHLALGSLAALDPACLEMVLGVDLLGFGPTLQGSPGNLIGWAHGPVPLSSAAL